jgi:hypothetical protein
MEHEKKFAAARLFLPNSGDKTAITTGNRYQVLTVLRGNIKAGSLDLSAGHSALVPACAGQTAEQIDGLRAAMEVSLARATETDARLVQLAEAMAAPRPEPQSLDPALFERIAAAQERVATLLEARDEETGRLDAETRARLRSLDTQVLRILEDLAAGRQDLVTEIRQDIQGLAEVLRGAAARGRF